MKYINKIDHRYYDQGDYFDKNIHLFNNFGNSFQKYRITNVLRLYKPKKNEKLLDLGCGWGTFCFILASQCKQLVGIDFSKKSIDLCNKELKKSNYKNIRFIKADAKKTGLATESFDVIIAADLFEHLYPKDSDKVITECSRVLKKGGKLVIWTPHRGHILEILKNHNIILKKDISHVSYKSMKYFIQTLHKNGFRIKKMYYVESHLPVFHLLERLLLRYLPLLRRRIAILAEKI